VGAPQPIIIEVNGPCGWWARNFVARPQDNMESVRFIEPTSGLNRRRRLGLRQKRWLVNSLGTLSGSVFALALLVAGSHPDVLAEPQTGFLAVDTSQSAYMGLPVHEIRFPNVSSENDKKQLRQVISQAIGTPLDREHIRQSIQALHATGRFADIRVEAEAADGGGVAVLFLTSPNFFVGKISVIGAPARPGENQVVNASKLQLGELFTEAKLDRARENIKQLMEQSGFYRSSLEAEELRHSDTQEMDVQFRLKPGAQARVGAVLETGNPGFSHAEIVDIARMYTGEYVSTQRLSDGLARLRKKYQKRNRWLAQVSARSSYRAAGNAVDYTFDIQPGPVVDIQTEGFKVSRSILKRNVPVYQENALDDDLLNEGRRNLLNYLQSRGYFDAKVELRKRGARTHQMRVVYVIEPGAAHKVVKVELVGNKYFTSDLIRPLMQVQLAGRLLSHGRYNQSLLNGDIRAIENLYRTNGFEEVKVTAKVEDDYQGQENQLAVSLHIEEGPQTLVGAFQIRGDGKLPRDIIDTLNTSSGQAFSESRVADDREIVLTYYFNHGFPDATFEANAKPSADHPHRVDVTFTISEGEQVFVNRVLVSGMHFTRPFVIQRELQMKPGDPLSQLDLLNTQKDLYDLGIFSQVDTAVQNPDGNEKDKNLLVEVEEAKRYTFNYGAGLEFQTGQPAVGTNQPQGQTGVSPRVSFGVTRLNFRGRNHTLTFKTNVGRLQQRALVSSDIPRWFSRPDFKLSVTAFYDNTVDVTTFTSQRLEGSVQAQENISKASTMVYSFTYRRVKATNLNITINQVPLLSQPVRVGMPGFTYIRNTRDNDLETTKGTYTTVDAGVAGTFFGSQPDFGRALVQNSTYHAFGKNRPPEKKYVLARSARIGLENPFGNTITPAPGQAAPANTSVIPLPELFLTGGGNSHRGFGLNQAGPRDPVTGFPLGGSAMFVNNLELRFPPVSLPFFQDNMSFALFHDAGNVFTNGHDLAHSLIHWKQADPQLCRQESTANQCNYNYISQAVGVGVRYKTPIGPVRFDFGYNLNPPVFPSCQQNTAFTGQAQSTYCLNATQNSTTPLPYFVPQQVHHFNVSFSIGQTF
jgi:outer membrane protein insertion porin family